jgi:hypothetical protein
MEYAMLIIIDLGERSAWLFHKTNVAYENLQKKPG